MSQRMSLNCLTSPLNVPHISISSVPRVNRVSKRYSLQLHAVSMSKIPTICQYQNASTKPKVHRNSTKSIIISNKTKNERYYQSQLSEQSSSIYSSQTNDPLYSSNIQNKTFYENQKNPHEMRMRRRCPCIYLFLLPCALILIAAAIAAILVARIKTPASVSTTTSITATTMTTVTTTSITTTTTTVTTTTTTITTTTTTMTTATTTMTTVTTTSITTTTTTITTTTTTITTTTTTITTTTTTMTTTTTTTSITHLTTTTDIPCSPPCNSQQICVQGVCVGIGYLSCTMTWSRAGDADIVVATPNNKIIFFGNLGPTSLTDQGKLDVDDRLGTGPENVFWSYSTPVPPTGIYYVCLSQYDFLTNATSMNPITATLRVMRSSNSTSIFTKTFTSYYKNYLTCNSASSGLLASFSYP